MYINLYGINNIIIIILFYYYTNLSEMDYEKIQTLVIVKDRLTL
jgi:hypothetical protein